MSNLQRHLTTNSNPPNHGRGRIPPAPTTNQRTITLNGNPPNNGLPPSAAHTPPATPTPPSNALVTIPLAPAPTPHPIQTTPPAFLTYIPPTPTALTLQPPPTTHAPAPGPSNQYVMTPTGPLALPPHHLSPSQNPHTPSHTPTNAYTPPTALPLSHPPQTSYLPPHTPHTTLLFFPTGPVHPWALPPTSIPTPISLLTPLTTGIHELIRGLGGEIVAGRNETVGVTTCTLWRRTGNGGGDGYREVDPREWMEGDGDGGRRRREGLLWRRGETYTLGEGGGGGESIGTLQGFRDGRGRGRGCVGVVAYVEKR